MKRLLIYYGWPSALNGGHPEDFDRYDYVVLGAGLEDPEHGDHAKTLRIVHDTPAKVFGYIDVGMTTSHYTLRRIRRSMVRWRRMGAVGVLLDDFGFDYGVPKRRQRRCVAEAHLLDLDVIANVWDPPTNLDPAVHPDFLLCESFYIKEGKYDQWWLDRADGYPGRVMAVTTNDQANQFRPDLWAEALSAAAGRGYEACGWGEYLFSANNSVAPWREST